MHISVDILTTSEDRAVLYLLEYIAHGNGIYICLSSDCTNTQKVILEDLVIYTPFSVAKVIREPKCEISFDHYMLLTGCALAHRAA